MPGRYRQLRIRDPDVFFLLPATSLAHRHARILRTFPVDLFSFCFTYPDLHHGLLALDSPTHPLCNPSKVAGRTRTIRNLVRRNLSYKPSPAAQAGAAWSVLSGSPFAVMNHATSCTLLVPVLRKACI